MATHEFHTLNELFLKAIDNHPKPDAFLSKSEGLYQGLSSLEALNRVAALSVALDRLQVRRGDRVAIFSENRVEWALADYAILGLGASAVPIYPTLFEPDLEFILRDSGAKGIVVGAEAQLQRVLKIRAGLPELGFVLAMESAPEASSVSNWKRVVESQLRAGPGNVEFFRPRSLAVKPQETASILYTSGTMGRPKGVILTHSNIVSNIQACQDLFSLGSSDLGLSFLPLSHIFERMLDYLCFWKGVSIAYAESYEALPQNLREVRPTLMAVVPRVLEKIHGRVLGAVRQVAPARQKLFAWAIDVGKRYFPYRLERRTPPLGLRVSRVVADRLIFSKIRAQLGGRVEIIISGAAPLSRDLAEFFCAVGLPVYEGYGLTETSPVIAVNYPGRSRLGTVGPVISGVEVRIDGAAGDAGAGGEILVRGPNVTPGYHHLEAENREAFVDGWFRTGDLGRLDSDGFLTITGRKKNLFKTSGGKYVSPEKLENLFQGHPYVSQLLILGDSRKFVAALIVPNFERLESYARGRGIEFRDRSDLVAKREIQSFMQQQVDEVTRQLPPHEKIRQIALLPKEFSIEAGELSTTLKIKRRVVEERYRDLIEELYSRPAPPHQPQVE